MVARVNLSKNNDVSVLSDSNSAHLGLAVHVPDNEKQLSVDRDMQNSIWL